MIEIAFGRQENMATVKARKGMINLSRDFAVELADGLPERGV